MKSKTHTPGPWETSRVFYNLTPELGVATYKIHKREDPDRCPQVTTTLDEADANARLIAAAPTLLSLLERVIKANGANHVLELKRECFEAIARATGGSNE